MPLVNVKADLSGLNPEVRSKLQDVPLVNRFVNKSSIESIVNYFQDLLAEEIGYELSYTNVFMLERSVMNDMQKSLNDLGVNSGGLLLRIQCKQDQVSACTEKPQPIANDSLKNDVQEKPKEVSTKIEPLVKKEPTVEIFKPNPQTIDPLASKRANTLEEERGPSIDDLKKYQQILKNQANSKTDYVTNKLRKEKEKRTRVQSSSSSNQNNSKNEVNMRIKFPDLTITNVKLPISQSNNQTTLVKNLIDFLNNDLLISNSLKYNLIIPRFSSHSLKKGKLSSSNSSSIPQSIYYRDIMYNGEILQRELTIYDQMSFQFEIIKLDNIISKDNFNYKIDSSSKGPFVKNLDSAQPIKNLIDETLDTESESGAPQQGSDKISKSEVEKQHYSRNLQTENFSTNEKKVPKWFKLNKK